MRSHYESSHVPMAFRTFPDIIEHRRSYVTKDGTMAPPGVVVPEVDCIAELRFADRSGFDRMMAIVMHPTDGAESVRMETCFSTAANAGCRQSRMRSSRGVNLDALLKKWVTAIDRRHRKAIA